MQGQCCLSLVRASGEGARDVSGSMISGRNQEGTGNGATPLAGTGSRGRLVRGRMHVHHHITSQNEDEEDADVLNLCKSITFDKKQQHINIQKARMFDFR